MRRSDRRSGARLLPPDVWMILSPARSIRTWPIAARIALVAALLVLLLLIVVAMLPLGWLRGTAQTALSAKLGRKVTVGAVERVDALSFSPHVAIRDVRVAQPAWAGPGDMLHLRAATLRLPLLPALIGRIRPREIALEGLRLALVADAGGRENWQADKRSGNGNGPPLDLRSLRDGRVTLRDARRHLDLTAAAAFDDRAVRLAGRGLHRGRPATLDFTADPVRGQRAWHFRTAFASPLARLSLDAVAARPLDFAHFSGAGAASGAGLQIVDDLIQAGLPGTQPVQARATIGHDGRRWTLTDLRGTIGRSDVAGRLTVARQGERTRLEGAFTSRGFDVDDLATDAELARGAAKRARIGDRVIPDTRVDLAKLARTDADVMVDVRRVLSRNSSAITAASARIRLDRSRLELDALRLALRHGELVGRGIVDQRGHGPVVTIDLALRGARVEDFITNDRVTAPLRGRIRLTGTGLTLRSALSRSQGEVALVAVGGSVQRAVAEVIGRNAGALFDTLLGDRDQRTPLRCAVMRMRGTNGLLRPTLFAMDTGVMSARGRGAINLDGERLTLVLDGRSRRPGLAQLPSPITINGTLSKPVIETADAGVGSARTILKTVGSVFSRLVKGRDDPPAPLLDCGALVRRAGL